MDKIIIFDTTLRDGEQAAGGMLNPREKLDIAKQLARLGVDVIEAGFPLSSPGDLEAVKLIAQELPETTICGLAHANAAAVDAAWEGVKGANRPRIHIFLSSSDIHLAYQLNKTREQILEMSRDMVARAKRYLEDVEYSPMDASRSDPAFLYRILQDTIEAGASTVNWIPMSATMSRVSRSTAVSGSHMPSGRPQNLC